MKIIIAIALSCLIPMPTAFADESGDTTRKIIEQLFESFNRHDTNALVDLYADDAVIMSPGDSKASIGSAAVREVYDDHFANIPDVYDAVQRIVVEGNYGAVEFIASWSQPTESDAEARGRLRIASFITIENGKIVRDMTYFDRVELSQNMDLE